MRDPQGGEGSIQLTLLLPAVDHQVYVSAVRRLRRLIGPQAPDLSTLIQHELSQRDAKMIASDYLEAHLRSGAAKSSRT